MLELKELGVFRSLGSKPMSPLPTAESSKDTESCFSGPCLVVSVHKQRKHIDCSGTQ